MRAMILAAGRGERMGALTQHVPKPLLKVRDRYLIEYAIANVKRAGIKEIVINVAYLAEQIQYAIGNGERYGVEILYSVEKERLEVGGGIHHALPMLGEKFIVVSSDVITDFPLQRLKVKNEPHLVLVKNPDFHLQGDFGLSENGYIGLNHQPKLTFANLGIYQADLFSDCKPGFFPWRDVMFPKIKQGIVSGEVYDGIWHNIGTVEALERANLAPSLPPI